MTIPSHTTTSRQSENVASRRAVLMGATLPFAVIPDFSMPLPSHPTPSPDAELIRQCHEHAHQWELANSLSDENEADAAVERCSVLCRMIASIKPLTSLGFAHKAEVVARENGFGGILSGRDLHPLDYDGDRVMFGLLADLIQGRPLT